MQRLLLLTLLPFIALVVLVACQPTGVAPAPAEEVEVTEEITPTEEMAPTEEVAPTEEMTPTEEIAPTEEVTETEEMTVTEEITPTEGVTPTEGMTETAAVNTVQVELISFEIRMPDTLPAGLTQFVVTNIDEEMEHNFEIGGPAIELRLDSNLLPGQSGVLEVDLAPGEYQVYCPVDDHAAEGMQLTLTVTEQ